MNREEFMRELVAKLSRLPEEERLEAIAYYEEYFDEAGPSREAEVIRGLGNPSDIAKQLMADFVVKEAEITTMKPKQSFEIVWIIIAALFAGPIALPIAITVAALGFAAAVTVGAFVFAGIVTGVALAGSGVLVGVVAIGNLFIHPATGLVMLGVSCVLMGVSLLIGMFLYGVLGKGLPALTKGFISLFNRVKGGKRTC